MPLRWRGLRTVNAVTMDSERHRVAVIRVEVREKPAAGLIIELLEVGRVPGGDRQLGSATTASGISRVIERWLQEMSSPAPTDGAAELDQALVAEGLASLAANRDRPYYDAAADADAAAQYYSAVDTTASGQELLRALRTLVTSTHARMPRYKPTLMVYPWVDLHPDRQLRSIYSGKSFDPEDVIRDDARIEAERTSRLQQLVAREAAIGPDAFTDELAELDAQLPYNCEHVVPQSSFAKKEPMRGDLHHLFTCQSRCNSFRSNTPYFEFDDAQDAEMDDCGRSEPGRFEPRAGKGAVARATLYFLLRYPGMIGDESRELQAERLPTLLAWHEAEPVGEWERHRNAAIAEIQGNRNPLIDNPQWASRIPFQAAFGRPGG